MKALLPVLLAMAAPALAEAPAGAAVAANPRDAGPMALVITYHVAPRDRIAFRRALQAGGAGPLARLKAEHRVRDYQLLWNRYVDDPAWTMMTFIQFATPADLPAWRKVEEQAPGGLPSAALALVQSIDTEPADLMRERHDDKPGDPAPVYLVVPYDYLIGTDAYIHYVDGYVLKQTDGWIQDGALAGYRFYLGRYATQRPWSSLLLLEYRGEAGLAARDATVARVRARLSADPAWTALADHKEKVRDERTQAVADPLDIR